MRGKHARHSPNNFPSPPNIPFCLLAKKRPRLRVTQIPEIPQMHRFTREQFKRAHKRKDKCIQENKIRSKMKYNRQDIRVIQRVVGKYTFLNMPQRSFLSKVMRTSVIFTVLFQHQQTEPLFCREEVLSSFECGFWCGWSYCFPDIQTIQKCFYTFKCAN